MQHHRLPEFDDETLEAINELREELNAEFEQDRELELQQMRDQETASKIHDDPEYGLLPEHVTRNDAIVAASAEYVNPVIARDEAWLNPLRLKHKTNPSPVESTDTTSLKSGLRGLRKIFEES